MLLRICCFSFVLLSSLISQNLSALPQFINEFHYDNKGADVNESVEILGLAGTNLNGWSLDFYNGSSGRIYTSWLLSGVFSDQQNGFGALAFSGGALQNGGNDGIALVDDQGLLVQFLSYEGQLTGTEGAALGHQSVDVGIIENGSTAVGSSIQLTGTGSNEGDFLWQVGQSSFGSVNATQNFLSMTLPTPPVSIPVPPLPAPLQTPPSAHAVPEPNTLMLLVLGLVFLLLGRRTNKFGTN